MDTDPRARRYPQELEDLAYEGYVLCHRSIPRLGEWLAEECPHEPYLPDERTLRRWRQSGEWDRRMTVALAEAFPRIRAQQMAQVVENAQLGLNYQRDLLIGIHDNKKPGIVLAKSGSALAAIQTGGLGTAGARAEGAQLGPERELAAIEEGLTPLERARRQREFLEKGR
ncbi:MAG: hypothetical protein M3Q74_04185, partial [Pseudomonadota bacterium]|nr:hypothetical protein [Pseudomonadota bacterium]